MEIKQLVPPVLQAIIVRQPLLHLGTSALWDRSALDRNQLVRFVRLVMLVLFSMLLLLSLVRRELIQVLEVQIAQSVVMDTIARTQICPSKFLVLKDLILLPDLVNVLSVLLVLVVFVIRMELPYFLVKTVIIPSKGICLVILAQLDILVRLGPLTSKKNVRQERIALEIRLFALLVQREVIVLQ